MQNIEIATQNGNPQPTPTIPPFQQRDTKLTSPDLIEKSDIDNSLRPAKLKDFLGQSPIKKNLSTFINAALNRGDTLDHTLLVGPAGLGKTTLSQIIAAELGVECKITSAMALDKVKDLVGILSNITPNAVFFIDEIHRLRPVVEEMLYIAMEDFEMDWVIGQGISARTVRVPIPRFTLVGATTKAGNISAPLRSRFGIIERFEYYSPEELKKVIMRSAKILNIGIEKEAALELGKCSRGTPRVANRLLRRMRDFANAASKSVIDVPVVKSGLAQLGIDFLGLEGIDRAILASIINKFAGGPVGSETLAISVSETVDTLTDYYEPYLIQCGLMQRTPRGRVATKKAYEHLGLVYAEKDGPTLF